MRNLVQHPITSDEIAHCLRELSYELNGEGKVGDIRPLLLETAAKVVDAADAMLKGIDKRLSLKDIPGRDGRRSEANHMKWVTPWKEATDLINAFQSANPKPEE